MRPARTVEPGCGTSPSRLVLGVLGACLGLLVGCGPSLASAPAGHPDEPVPPGEPRAELRLELDLAPAQDCEETFDLAMYQDRGIELIEWDDRKGSCEKRAVTIRYLSRKLSAEDVRQTARAHSQAVRDARAAPAKPPRSRTPRPSPPASAAPPPQAPLPSEPPPPKP